MLGLTGGVLESSRFAAPFLEIGHGGALFGVRLRPLGLLLRGGLALLLGRALLGGTLARIALTLDLLLLLGSSYIGLELLPQFPCLGLLLLERGVIGKPPSALLQALGLEVGVTASLLQPTFALQVVIGTRRADHLLDFARHLPEQAA